MLHGITFGKGLEIVYDSLDEIGTPEFCPQAHLRIVDKENCQGCPMRGLGIRAKGRALVLPCAEIVKTALIAGLPVILPYVGEEIMGSMKGNPLISLLL